MWSDFLISWELFHNTYLAGWLMALLLSLVGVLVVARDQIFLGAAVAQASTLGVAVGMGLAIAAGASSDGWLWSNAFLSAMAVLFSILGALLGSRGSKPGHDSHEAVTGWVFLIAASGAILLMAHSPHGMEEVHRLLFSSIIGADLGDILVFGSLAAVTVGFVTSARRPLLLFATDPEMAAAVGMRVGLWSALAFLWIGLAIGLSIRSSGTLYTFGCLVLPALAAKNVCPRVAPMLWVSPLVALATSFLAFVIANHYDYPPAQMAVAILCLVLVPAWLWRRWRA